MIEWVDKAEKLQQYIMIFLFYSVAHNACLKASAAILVKLNSVANGFLSTPLYTWHVCVDL